MAPMTDELYLRVSGAVTPHLARVIERAVEICNSEGYNYLAVEHIALAMLENERWYGIEDWDEPLSVTEWRRKLTDGLPPLPTRQYRIGQPVTVEYDLPDPPDAPAAPCPYIQEFEFEIFTAPGEIAELAAFVAEYIQRRSTAVDGLSWQVEHGPTVVPKRALERRWRASHPDTDAGERANLSISVGIHLVDSGARDTLLNDLCATLPVSDAPWVVHAKMPETAEEARLAGLGAKYPDLAHLEPR